jgi:hypothetical protein
VGEVAEDPYAFLEGIPLPAVMVDAGGTLRGWNSRFSCLTGGLQGEGARAGGFGFVEEGDRERLASFVMGLVGGRSSALGTSLLRKGGGGIQVMSFWCLSEIPVSTSPKYLGLFLETGAGDPPVLPGAGSGGDPVPAGTSPHSETTRAGTTVPVQLDPVSRDRIIHTIIFHDAKNRLAALHGYASLLRESLAGSAFLAYLDKLEEIASDIERDLGVAAIFSHLGLIALRWQNLREVIGKSASRESQLRIFMDELPGSLWCCADPLFPRVFSNLFENARRHGERVTTIRIGAKEADTGLVISIEDDGIGIPQDQKERIFEIGFGRHTGYGLYLAREILSIAGFSIRETGDPGKGARFDIHIPRGRYMLRESCPKEPDSVRIPAM